MKLSARPARGQDVFAEARDKFTIPALWELLALPGEPKASCRSPFRDERSPSFTIFAECRQWKDHGTGEGGDVVEFLRVALGISHKEARTWFAERLGTPALPPRRPLVTSQAPKRIKWPAELVEGTEDTWGHFAGRRGFSPMSVQQMVRAGILRFTRIDGVACFVITDDERRAAEIRRMDGKLFGESKVFPLAGVDKRWLTGLELLKDQPRKVSVLITEGSTDLLAAFHLYHQFRREGGDWSWNPVALLGSKCRGGCPEVAALLRGRHVRLIPDADPDGDQMADHWQGLLRKIGCSVDVVNLPPGTDLSDNLTSISPPDLFSK
jgi:hypothetical protein